MASGSGAAGSSGAPPPPPGPAPWGQATRATQVQPLGWWEYQETAADTRQFAGKGGWLEAAAARSQREREEATAAAELSAAARGRGAAPKALPKPKAVRELHAKKDLVQPALGEQRNIIFVRGRPVLMLQLSHPGATAEEKLPYLKSVLSPAHVLAVQGRFALSEPTCPRDRAVFHGWQDAVLPLALSPQTPPDTLTLVFEADYRFAAEHAQACRQYEADVGTEPADALRYQEGGASSSSTARPSGAKGGAADERSASAQAPWWQRSHPAANEEGQELNNPLLEDLVSWANQAARNGRGDFVWYSWLSAKAKKGGLQPNRASTLIGLSKTGALRLQEFLLNKEPGHLDVLIANGLRTPGSELSALQASACYVYPTCGGFQEHQSGCEKDLLRTEEWERFQAWTRRMGQFEGRYLVAFGESGPWWDRQVCPLSEDEKSGYWFTWLPRELRNADNSINMDAINTALHGPSPDAEMTDAGDADPESVQPGVAPATAPQDVLDVVPTTAAAADQGPMAPDRRDAPEVLDVPDLVEPNSGPSAEAVLQRRLGKRRKMAEPVDAAGAGQEADATKHRQRQRRAGVLRYWRFRVFGLNKAVPGNKSVCRVSFQPPLIALARVLHSSSSMLLFAQGGVRRGLAPGAGHPRHDRKRLPARRAAHRGAEADFGPLGGDAGAAALEAQQGGRRRAPRRLPGQQEAGERAGKRAGCARSRASGGGPLALQVLALGCLGLARGQPVVELARALACLWL